MDLNNNGVEADAVAPVLVMHDATATNDAAVPAVFTRVGTVTHWNQSPSFTEVAVHVDPTREVKPGQFLGVWHGRRGQNVITIIQVGNSFEVNPNEEPALAAAREALGLSRSYGREGVSTRIFRLAECSTMEEFELCEKSWRIVGEGRAAEALCRAGDPVVLLPPEMVIATIGGLTVPNDGIHLGKTYDAAQAPVTLKPVMFQLHAGLFGNPGRGKSYLGGNLIEEAHAWGIPTLVLDINGEMIEAAKALGGLVITLPDSEKFGVSLSMMTPLELVQITPNVRPGTNYAELIEIAHDKLRNESRGKPISFEQLVSRIQKLGEETKAGTSTGTAIARVRALENDPLIGHDFDFISQLLEHRLVVLDCRFLSVSQTRLIAAMGARHLQKIGRDNARNAEKGDQDAASWFALYFIDEAHTVMPDDEKVVSTQVFYELARMGRHVRTGLVLSSQSPQDLNPSILKRLQTRFVFALEKSQLSRIEGVLADLDEKLVRQLPKLPKGKCAVSGTSEVIRHGFLLDVRERVTPVGGRTPSVFAGRTKRVEAEK
jgi:uncharacterized protein